MFNRQVWTRLNISQLTEFSIVQSLPVDSCLMLCDIRSLSDDEGSAELVGPRQVGRRKRKAELSAIAESEIRKSLRHLVAAHCKCHSKRRSTITKRNCYTPFREPHAFKAVFDLRKELRSMHKADADQLAACSTLVCFQAFN